MLPQQANPNGVIHGGEMVKLMDTAAAVVAQKHTGNKKVVSARIDEVEFHHPILIGDLTTCHAKLTFTGTTSMEVGVHVTIEDVTKAEPAKTAVTALFTFIALTDEGKPMPVPALELTTDEERHLFEAGRQRYLTYKQHRKNQ